MKENQSATELFGEVIYSYTRAQAIEDGVLVDVSKTAREAGFRWPVAMTSAAWADCVTWSEEDNQRQVYQDESGRLWTMYRMYKCRERPWMAVATVLWMAFVAIRSANGGAQMEYQLYRVPRDGKSVEAQLTSLKLVCGPGDDGEPVITIMLPRED
jgi:hypothetical protein